ncbi:MAG: hypothetical protein HYV27_24335 [Candidatus Hydrogenedentes bacterium]|nr:hypothetical protein [Candidatus Hydrogenedentota bacterium]
MSYWNRVFNYDGPILGRPLRIALSAVLGVFISLICSVYAVQWLAPPPPVPVADNSSRVREARILRSFSNRLVGIAAEFVERVPAGETVPRPTAQRWINDRFRSEVYSLAQDVDSTPLSLAEYAVLRRTIHDTLSMANNSSDWGLRHRVLEEIPAAVEAVEGFVAGHGLDAFLSEKRQPFPEGLVP